MTKSSSTQLRMRPPACMVMLSQRNRDVGGRAKRKAVMPQQQHNTAIQAQTRPHVSCNDENEVCAAAAVSVGSAAARRRRRSSSHRHTPPAPQRSVFSRHLLLCACTLVASDGIIRGARVQTRA